MGNPMYKHQMPTERLKDEIAELRAMLDRIRRLVNESEARMEPVSWIAALREIIDEDETNESEDGGSLR